MPKDPVKLRFLLIAKLLNDGLINSRESAEMRAIVYKDLEDAKVKTDDKSAEIKSLEVKIENYLSQNYPHEALRIWNASPHKLHLSAALINRLKSLEQDQEKNQAETNDKPKKSRWKVLIICGSLFSIFMIGYFVFPMFQDADGDRISNYNDACPDLPGTISCKGCPDRDNDSVTDASDVCPDIPGLKVLDGCNDLDQDGVMDVFDNCPILRGDNGCQGCKMNDKIPKTIKLDKLKNQIARIDKLKMKPGTVIQQQKSSVTIQDTVYNLNYTLHKMESNNNYYSASIENNKNTIKIKYYFQSGSLFFIKYEDNFDSLEYYFNTNGAIFDFKGNNIQPFPKIYPHKLQYVLSYFYKLDKVFNY